MKIRNKQDVIKMNIFTDYKCYGIEGMCDGDIKVSGSRRFIEDSTDQLWSLGYDAGQTISDFRPSYFITNAPMDVVEGVLERLETK